MPEVTTHTDVHKWIDDLIEVVVTKGQDDELVAILLQEAVEFLKTRQPRGGALSDDQVAYLIESDGFTSSEFAEIEANLARGDLVKEELKTQLATVANSLSADEVALRLDIDASRVSDRQVQSDLYSFTAGGRRRYPEWQFTSDSAQRLLPGLTDLVRGLPAGLHAASVEGFMTTPQEDLVVNGQRMTPVEWLLQGGDPQELVSILDSFIQS
jgi:hypothetical protein